MSAFSRPALAPKRNPYRANRIGKVTFVVGAEATNAITVNCQLKDERLRDLAIRGHANWFIASDVTGDTLVATAPDGGVAAGTDGWVAQIVTGKYGVAVSEADGDLDIVVTHAAGVKTVYLGIVLPDGSIIMSSAITFA